MLKELKKDVNGMRQKLFLKIFDVTLFQNRQIISKLLIFLIEIFQTSPIKRFSNENDLDPPHMYAERGMSNRASNYMQFTCTSVSITGLLSISFILLISY